MDSDPEEEDMYSTISRILAKSGASPIKPPKENCHFYPDSDSDSGSETSNILDWLHKLQDKFSIAPPSNANPCSDNDDDDDDDDDSSVKTLAAINSRLDQYQSQPQLSSQPQSPQQEEETNVADAVPANDNRFPRCMQNFVDAVNKNRACQRLIRTKLMEIQAKIEENKKLKARVQCLVDYQHACKRKTSILLGQHKDPRASLISAQKSMRRSKDKKKKCYKKPAASCLGPKENPCVAIYCTVMERESILKNKRRWSNEEKESVTKGLRQQYQETLLVNSMNDDEMMIVLRDDMEITPEAIRSFAPMVDWDRLASMYVAGRSGAECESKWLNCEDPLICHGPWTNTEDKGLLFIIQERGLYNWIEIALLLGTRRTPFQCLARYQMSLNPYILNRDWTKDEDERLQMAVEEFGEKNWQNVASCLEGRTGTQCSNRWKRSIGDGRRVGRWSVEEDKRLKVAVTLFGAKNWNKMARFIPGRNQAQCRDRWLNSLDSALKLEPWDKEEDARLLEAIDEHGYKWSKVAACLAPRNDNQCLRRWRTLRKADVPLLQEARRLKKTVLISNFVDRENERPAIGPSDFLALVNVPPSMTENSEKVSKKRSRVQRDASGSEKQNKKAKRKPRRSLVTETSGAAATGAVRRSKRKMSKNDQSNDASGSEKQNKKAKRKPRRSPVTETSGAAANGSVRRSKRKMLKNDQSNDASGSEKQNKKAKRKPRRSPVTETSAAAASGSVRRSKRKMSKNDQSNISTENLTETIFTIIPKKPRKKRNIRIEQAQSDIPENSQISSSVVDPIE